MDLPPGATDFSWKIPPSTGIPDVRVRVLAKEATRDRLSALRQLLDDRPGECAVALHLLIPDESETVVALSGRRGVRPDASLRQRVDDLFGRR